MLYSHNGESIGINRNPLIKSVFSASEDDGQIAPPPHGAYIILEGMGENFIVTEGGDRMVTE